MNYAYPEDTGTYTCVARNKAGQAETSARLVCHGKESLFLQPQHVESLPRIEYIEGQQVHIGPMAVDRPEEIQSLEMPHFTPIGSNSAQVRSIMPLIPIVQE